jgi:hypothetical protein
VHVLVFISIDVMMRKKQCWKRYWTWMKYQHMNVHWYQCNDVKETMLKKVLNMDEISTYGEYKMYRHHGNGHEVIKRLLFLYCVRTSTMLCLFAFAKVDYTNPWILLLLPNKYFHSFLAKCNIDQYKTLTFKYSPTFPC